MCTPPAISLMDKLPPAKYAQLVKEYNGCLELSKIPEKPSLIRAAAGTDKKEVKKKPFVIGANVAKKNIDSEKAEIPEKKAKVKISKAKNAEAENAKIADAAIKAQQEAEARKEDSLQILQREQVEKNANEADSLKNIEVENAKQDSILNAENNRNESLAKYKPADWAPYIFGACVAITAVCLARIKIKAFKPKLEKLSFDPKNYVKDTKKLFEHTNGVRPSEEGGVICLTDEALNSAKHLFYTLQNLRELYKLPRNAKETFKTVHAANLEKYKPYTDLVDDVFKNTSTRIYTEQFKGFVKDAIAAVAAQKNKINSNFRNDLEGALGDLKNIANDNRDLRMKLQQSDPKFDVYALLKQHYITDLLHASIQHTENVRSNVRSFWRWSTATAAAGGWNLFNYFSSDEDKKPK